MSFVPDFGYCPRLPSFHFPFLAGRSPATALLNAERAGGRRDPVGAFSLLRKLPEDLRRQLENARPTPSGDFAKGSIGKSILRLLRQRMVEHAISIRAPLERQVFVNWELFEDR